MKCRKLLIIALAAALAASAAGCGGSGAPEAQSPPASQSSASAATEAPAATASEATAEAGEAPEASVDAAEPELASLGLPDVQLADKKLKIYAIDENWVDSVRSKTEIPGAIEICEQEYGMEFEVVAFADYAKQVEVMTALYMSGDMPDYYSVANFPTDLMNDFLQPIDPYIDLSAPLWDDVRPIMDMIRWNDKNYFAVMYPFGIGDMVFYNPQIFESNGIPDPNTLYDQGEWTFEKMKEVAIALTYSSTGDGVIDKYGLGWSTGALYLHSQTGVPLVAINPDKTVTHNLRDPKIAEAAEFYRSLGPSGSNCTMFPAGDITQDTVAQQFGAGNIAMLVSGWWRGEREELINNWAKGLVDVAPPPSWKGEPIHTWGQLGTRGICNNAKNPEAAALFIEVNKWCGTQAYTDKYNPTQRKYVTQTDVWGCPPEVIEHWARFDDIVENTAGSPVPTLFWIFWNWDDGFDQALTDPWSAVLERLEPIAQAGIDEKMEMLSKIG
jgi:multiple sugar transport system substrate-binding protein